MTRVTALCGLMLASLTVVSGPARGDIRREPIRFAPGKSAATIRGSIKGDEAVDYVFAASAGQQVTVTLKSSNGSNYFNVMPPASDYAVFDGATSGNTWTGTLNKDGEYRLRVYLQDKSGLPDQSARYTLDVAIAGARADR